MIRYSEELRILTAEPKFVNEQSWASAQVFMHKSQRGAGNTDLSRCGERCEASEAVGLFRTH